MRYAKIQRKNGAKCSKKENDMRFNNSPSSQDKYGYEEFSRFLRRDSHTHQGICDDKPSERVERLLAMVYPEKQKFVKIFDPEAALQCGTMFEELFMPFNRGSCRGNNKGEGC
jgi:hypothetical protein